MLTMDPTSTTQAGPHVWSSVYGNGGAVSITSGKDLLLGDYPNHDDDGGENNSSASGPDSPLTSYSATLGRQVSTGDAPGAPALWKQQQQHPHHQQQQQQQPSHPPGLWGSGSTATTASSWQSWADQRDASQHSRGSIWGASSAADDYSRTSQGSLSNNNVINHHPAAVNGAVPGFPPTQTTSSSSISSRSQTSLCQTPNQANDRLIGSTSQDDSNNSLEEEESASLALEANLARLSLSGVGCLSNHHPTSALMLSGNDYDPCLSPVDSPIQLLSPQRKPNYLDGRSFPASSALDVSARSASAFSPRFVSSPYHHPNYLSSVVSIGSSIPGLAASSSSTTSGIAAPNMTSFKASKLNPNMSSWHPHSAPVGSPRKSSLAAALAAATRNGNATPSPLSSVLVPPPLFQADQHRGSPSNLSAGSIGHNNNHSSRMSRRCSTGGSVGMGASFMGSSGKGGRDRQRANRKKQQHVGQKQQRHSPQAYKENDPLDSSYGGSGASSLLMSPIPSGRGVSSNCANMLLGCMPSPSPSLTAPASPGPASSSSEAIRALMKPRVTTPSSRGCSASPYISGLPTSLTAAGSNMLDSMDESMNSYMSMSYRGGGNDLSTRTADTYPILPAQPAMSLEDVFPSYFETLSEDDGEEDDTFDFEEDDIAFDDDVDDDYESTGSWADAAATSLINPYASGEPSSGMGGTPSANSTAVAPGGASRSKKRDWLIRMNRKLQDIPVGELDPAVMPLSAIMNAWAKTKSAHGASMVEMWLKRAQEEYNAGNKNVVPTTKMYTMAVDAWARSGEGGAAAHRAETLLQHMHRLYQEGGHDELRPTNAIFNAVINAWARSREKIAPVRAEQILNWMKNLSSDLDIQPDKYTFNTVIHAWAKAGGTEAATKAQDLLAQMHTMYQAGNVLAKPDTISYNVVINAWAKSGGKGAANEAEKLLLRMHRLHEMGDPDVKPNVVTYGAVIDSFAKSGERGAASRADTLLANMIQLHQSDPVKHSDLLPNTYVFNTVINCWAKSKEHDATSKAEEMLVAMSRLHASGMPNLKPDNFTYTAVIDAWAKSGYKGAASRADQLLDKMEAKYLAGDVDLKPNSYTYNAVICALAKSGEPGAAARAERVLQNMVNRHSRGGDDDIKPTTINFNTVLDAWAKSRGGKAAAERAEEILEWMDHLHKGGNPDVKVDTISFNAVLDAWARSGDRMAPRRAEQILAHMDELYRSGNKGVKPDRYTYNTLINVWAKSGERGSASRAEHVLSVMEKRHRDGDQDFKPNTRTYTSVIDALAKSGEPGAARRAEQILNNMISRYEAAGDPDIRPNVHTANAVCNACAFSKNDEDREEALNIAFRVFDWLANQSEMSPDSYTYTILLSVCANLLPREDGATRYAHAKVFFESCRDAGYVNDYVLRKLRQTVSEDEFLSLIDYRTDASASCMPSSWTRNAKLDSQNFHSTSKPRKSGTWSNNRRKGK